MRHLTALLALTALPLTPQTTDTFNTGTGCEQARNAERATYQSNLAAIERRRIDIERDYTTEMTACRERAQANAHLNRDSGRRADTTCQDQASAKEASAFTALDQDTARENARHRKAELDIEQTCNPYQVDAPLARTRRLGATPIVIPKSGTAGKIADKLLPTPWDAIQAKDTFLRHSILSFAPEVLGHLTAEMIDADNAARALRSQRQLTPADRQQLSFLDKKMILIKTATRELRILYTDTYNKTHQTELSGYARPDALNWPQYAY